MTCTALCMQRVHAYLALEGGFVLLYVLLAPMAQICTNDKAWPFVTVGLQVAWMDVEVAIAALFGNGFRY